MSSYREEGGKKFLRHLYEHPELVVAVDTETEGLNVADGRDTCIGISVTFCLGAGESAKFIDHYFALNHTLGENISNETFKMLRYVLTKQNRWLVFANRQFDILSMETVDIMADKMPFFDIQTMAQMVDENLKSKSLDDLAKHYLREEKVSGVMVNRAGQKFDIEKEKKTGWQNTTPEMMWPYACRDTNLTLRVAAALQRTPQWNELPPEVWDNKQHIIRILTEIRRRGVFVDLRLAAAEEAKGVQRMEEIKAELGLDPAKASQLKELMIDRLGLPVLKRSTKTNAPSFAKEVMDEYDIILERDGRREAKLIKEFRGYQKAVTAFFRPYQALISPDGRLRATYNTHVTRTGRLSCSDPNLQQIPKKSDDPEKKPWHRNVKACFIPKTGYKLINADFSQLELRIAAGMASEEQLKTVFAEGRDIFTEMSSQLGMTRQDTKTLVYSMQYGAGLPRLMNAFGVTKAEADRLRTNYFQTYPRFKALNDAIVARADRDMQVPFWSGRIRHFKYPGETYKAMNSVIQGGAADVVERVMIRVFQEIDSPECRVLQQVHDSLLFEIREDLVEEYSKRIEELMSDVDAVTRPRGEFGVVFSVEVEEWG